MSYLMTIAGWLQILFGVFIFSESKSAMHETTAVVAIGAGVVALALGRLLQYKEEEVKDREDAERQAKQDARAIRPLAK